jgi:signal transduction histidine kinase
MSETYLVLIIGAIAGLVSAVIGGMILYRNRLKTHLMFRQRVEEERTALSNELSEMDKEEFSKTDAGKHLMALSQASIQRFGYPQDDLTASLRRHNYDLLRQIEEDRKRLLQSEERLAAMEASQRESENTLQNLRKDNEGLRLANNLRNSSTSTNGAQIERDLRIALEEAARLQNQLAEANMRLIEVEVGGIAAFSQELRQTLSSTLQSIDMLLDESVGTLNAMQRNFLDTIKGSTTRLRGVIDDFIQVTSLKADSHAAAHDPVDLNLIIKDAIAATSSEIRAKRIALNLELPEDAAPFYADRAALQQILIRLLSNAGAASTLQGTVRLRVHIRAEDDQEHVLIQVSDTGGGIPPEDRGRVFAPLYRAEDVPARGVGDTGIGLYVAKTLTESQNGRIWVETELGVGSTYNVLFPIHRNIPANVSTAG